MTTSVAKAFGLSAVLSLFCCGAWVFAVWEAVRAQADRMASVVLGSYALVVVLSGFASIYIFKERRWQAACGSLAASSTFICVVAALVARHHYITSGR